jgi:hypothetical protein
LIAYYAEHGPLTLDVLREKTAGWVGREPQRRAARVRGVSQASLAKKLDGKQGRCPTIPGSGVLLKYLISSFFNTFRL